MITTNGVVMETVSIPADPASVASFLRRLANRIEAGEGDEILIGMWNLGSGMAEDWEWVFQVVIDAATNDGAPSATKSETNGSSSETGS